MMTVMIVMDVRVWVLLVRIGAVVAHGPCSGRRGPVVAAADVELVAAAGTASHPPEDGRVERDVAHCIATLPYCV